MHYRSLATLGFACLGLLSLTACGGVTQLSEIPRYGEPVIRHAVETREERDIPKAVKVGKPYKIMGQRYVPHYDPDYEEVGTASWYGPGFHGKRTANGEVYDKYDYTAAHRTLPLPSIVRVSNVENGKSVVVRVNDRGPFSKGRIIDLSQSAAKALDMIGPGTARVKVSYLPEDTERLWAALDMKNRPAKPKSSTIQLASRGPSSPAEVRAPAPLVKAMKKVPLAQVIAKELSPIATAHAAEPARALASIGGQGASQLANKYLQVGSYSSRENAEAVSVQLASLGSSIMLPVEVANRRYYRVALGPIHSSKLLQEYHRRLIDLGFDSATIVSYD